MLNIKTGDSDPEMMGWRSRGKTVSLRQEVKERDESEKDFNGFDVVTQVEKEREIERKSSIGLHVIKATNTHTGKVMFHDLFWCI